MRWLNGITDSMDTSLAGDPDGDGAQDQGYVVALAGKFVAKPFFVTVIVVHALSTSEKQYCHFSRK